MSLSDLMKNERTTKPKPKQFKNVTQKRTRSKTKGIDKAVDKSHKSISAEGIHTISTAWSVIKRFGSGTLKKKYDELMYEVEK